MALQLRYETLPGVLRMEAIGTATLADISALIDALARETRRGGHRRALVNLLAVKEGLKFTDHYSVGEQVARELGHLVSEEEALKWLATPLARMPESTVMRR